MIRWGLLGLLGIFHFLQVVRGVFLYVYFCMCIYSKKWGVLYIQ